MNPAPLPSPALGGGWPRDAALDGMRGLAIGMVLLLHGFTLVPGGLLTRISHHVTSTLYIGVDLFFVLSGFLITSILLATREQRGYFRNFYVRRMLRIFPAYYLVLAACYAIRPLGAEPALQAQMDQDAVYYALYLQNVVMAVRGRAGAWIGLDPTWSLAIEEQFYLLWPVVVLLVRPRALIHVCIALAIASTLIRMGWDWYGVPLWSQYVTTLTHAEGLCFGAAIASRLHAHPGDRPPRWLRIAGVSCSAYLVALQPAWADQSALHPLLVATLFSWILFEVVSAPGGALLRRMLQVNILTWLGRYSYGIYLIHYPVLALIGAHYWQAWSGTYGPNMAILMGGMMMVTITLPLAVAMYHGLEAPLLSLKRYFAPARSPA